MSTSDVTKKAQVGSDELTAEALKIVEQARTEGITLRVTGGVAIFHLAEKEPAIRQVLLRNRKAGSSGATFADIDLVGYSKQTKLLNKLLLEELHFQKDKIINALFGDRRRIYYHPQGTYHIDILLDVLEFNHDIDIRGRLELAYPNLNAADLLLTKLQIHYINEKDLLDIIVLSVLDGWVVEKDIQRVVEILSDDWDFYYEAVNNLKLASEMAKKMSQEGKVTQLRLSTERINSLMQTLEQAPKTKKWEKRARKGPDKAWWREIEDVLR